MWLKFRERFSAQICQQPDNSLRAVLNFCLHARFAAQRRNHARQRQFTRRRYQMLQHRALHLHEPAFAVRMHDFQNEFAAAGFAQTKIVVVLARKRVRGSFYTKKPPRNFRCFGFCDGFRYRRFSHGALNFSGKRFARPIFRPVISGRHQQNQSIEIGPLTVEARTNVGPLPNSTRFLSSSHVLRPSEQTLARQSNGLWPSDSTTTPDWYPCGTRIVNGPFCACACKPEPSQLFPLNATSIGPFCVRMSTLPLVSSEVIGPLSVCSSTVPLVPFAVIGPFCAVNFTSPLQSRAVIGPFTARAVIFPLTE